MIALIGVERIKLFSTRSPWWCVGAAIVLPIVVAVVTTVGSGDSPVTLDSILAGGSLGLYTLLVMAMLAITTEYRFNTIKLTFQAAPDRVSPLLAKAAVVAGVACLAGWAASFGSVGVSKLLAENGSRLVITSGSGLRAVLGLGLICAASAVLALGIGGLIRHTAGALTLILVFGLVVEPLVRLIPKVGEDVYEWMPFVSAFRLPVEHPPTDVPSPWASFAYLSAIAVAVFALSLVVIKRRDA
nr:ABC transporter permease [Saccharothrix mutabilis subsp. capreolus]